MTPVHVMERIRASVSGLEQFVPTKFTVRGERRGGTGCVAVVLISRLCLSTPKNYGVSFEIMG